jgi:hypothetical protein
MAACPILAVEPGSQLVDSDQPAGYPGGRSTAPVTVHVHSGAIQVDGAGDAEAVADNVQQSLADHVEAAQKLAAERLGPAHNAVVAVAQRRRPTPRTMAASPWIGPSWVRCSFPRRRYPHHAGRGRPLQPG